MFRVDHAPREGRYDLHLAHANYDRDNGRFECRIKEDGTGVELYTVTVGVTVLLPPGPASITKSSVEAVEGAGVRRRRSRIWEKYTASMFTPHF